MIIYLHQTVETIKKISMKYAESAFQQYIKGSQNPDPTAQKLGTPGHGTPPTKYNEAYQWGWYTVSKQQFTALLQKTNAG